MSLRLIPAVNIFPAPEIPQLDSQHFVISCRNTPSSRSRRLCSWHSSSLAGVAVCAECVSGQLSPKGTPSCGVGFTGACSGGLTLCKGAHGAKAEIQASGAVSRHFSRTWSLREATVVAAIAAELL